MSRMVEQKTYRREFPILEGMKDAVDLQLAIDVILLLLGVGGSVDIRSHGDGRFCYS